ncbi:hypothetical protein BT96DRAFT_1041925 [Gymnopus androsaceus JB14]|uniref:O-methyltransferase domain-containing protein n=1 Tax=Gymnopus androsaceus JB14 TaxID=1447944 RepID=A0A6A4IBY8_9AGAR|nr:hypothetical protein BT96DRAFT_1041925 [Gymnopus androsaceus JB14]
MAASLRMSEELVVLTFRSFNIAHNSPKKIQDWLKDPNDHRSRKFTGSMKSINEAIYSMFTSRYRIPNIKQPSSREASVFGMNRGAPEGIYCPSMVLQAYSVFNPQPIKNAAVYILRMIIHDWPDKDERFSFTFVLLLECIPD